MGSGEWMELFAADSTLILDHVETTLLGSLALFRASALEATTASNLATLAAFSSSVISGSDFGSSLGSASTTGAYVSIFFDSAISPSQKIDVSSFAEIAIDPTDAVHTGWRSNRGQITRPEKRWYL